MLSIAKLLAGYLLNASSLIADGFNNLSDIVGNIALLIGLHLASQPADANHKFSTGKLRISQALSPLSLCLLLVFRSLSKPYKVFSVVSRHRLILSVLLLVSSALIMLGVYTFNKRLSKRVKSSALVAASKDNLSDAVTSLGTSVAIVAASLKLPIIDRLAALIITFFILKTAFDIFMESAFSLSDGFDSRHLKKYEKAILEIPKIVAVKSQRGRTYGSNVYLDIVLEMNPDLSVYESHTITEQVEQLLSDQFAIYDIDIHVEPAMIPEDEIFDNVAKKLYRYEKLILSKVPDYDHYIAKSFQLIDANGKTVNYEQFLNQEIYYPSNFKHFQIESISQKTMLVTYQLNGNCHTSIWRRYEVWCLLFHQITPIQQEQRLKRHYRIVKG